VDAGRGVPGPVIADRVETDRYLWNHPVFEFVAKKVGESDAFDAQPCVAKEGLYSCKKCGSNRTFSFGKQTRGLDEGTTVFVKCVKCFTNWVVGG